MLVGISPLLSPELLAELYRMGHGDEIVLADAHFPGEAIGRRCLRSDRLRVPDLLDAILPLFYLDAYVEDSVIMMAPVPGDHSIRQSKRPIVMSLIAIGLQRHRSHSLSVSRSTNERKQPMLS